MGTRRTMGPKSKREKVGRILQVQEMIDLFVLTEIEKIPKYIRELDGDIPKLLGGFGVNTSYLSRRIQFMAEQGYLTLYWEDPVKR